MFSPSSLNHVYRTVWNDALGAMVAVAENAPGHQGSGGTGVPAVRNRALGALSQLALAVALVWSVAPHAYANPEGGVAIHGQASMASNGNVLTVTTQNGAGTNHSAINWQSFSIPAGSTTQIVQPNAASLSINRVVTNTPSVLFGTLSSNGQVVLVNQAGIAVGSGALVDTAGFTASAVGMTAQDAMAGRLRFAGDGITNATGALTVQGNIIARGGDVVLIAPSVEMAQTAVVESQGGSVVLAAGQSVEVTGRGLEGITLQVQAPTDQAINLGTLKGDAVGIFAGTLKHSGQIQATQARVEGGRVVLKASGDAYVEGDGRIDATSSTGKGGTIQVLGQRVAVTDNAVLDASGATGGGTVLVGGDYQGKNGQVQNANVTYFGANANLKADATDNGQGGKVIVWADDTTRAYGAISARGGAHGGNGGFVETSGKRYLDVGVAYPDVRAPMGVAGTWLLDPEDITIAAATGVNITAGPTFSPATAGSSTLDVAVLNAYLNTTGNASVDTSGGGSGTGNITVSAPILWTSTNVLTLKATVGISVQDSVSGLNGTLSLLAGGSIDNNSGGGLIHVSKLEATANGSIALQGMNQISNLAASSGGASLSVEAAAASGLTIGSVGSTSGLSAYAGITVKQYTAGGITVDKSISSTTAGAVSLGVASGTGGIVLGNAAAVSLTGSGGVDLYTSGGAITQTNSVTVSGPLTMTTNSTSGGITLANASNDFTGLVTINANGAGAVTLVDTNALTLGSMPISGALSATSGGALTASGAITTANGDIVLKAAGLDQLLTISNSVQATNGNVTYIADNLAHSGSTQSSGAAGKYVEVKPYTANTAIELSSGADANGFLRLTSNEINSFTTPLFKLGSSSMTGNIAVTQVFNPANFSSMSLITSGSITQSAGSTLAIANLNADGLGGVTLTEANSVGTLAGHTSAGNFAFTNSGALSVGTVDINSGVVSDSGGNITLTSGSNISLGVVKSSGTVSVTSSGGAILDTNGVANNIVAGNATLSAYSGIGSSDAIEIQAGTLSASNSMLNDIVLDVTGAVSLGSMSPASSGRWLIYATDPSSVTPGAVTANFSRLGATYVSYPNPTEVGNGFIYASAAAVPAAGVVNTPTVVPAEAANVVTAFFENFETAIQTQDEKEDDKDRLQDALVLEGEICKP